MDSLDLRGGDSYRVETPERIDLEFDVAGLGSRLLAAMVDTALLTLIVALVAILGTLGLAALLDLVAGPFGMGGSGTLSTLALAAIVLLVFATFWAYYVLFELVWHGQSPGKRWVGLRVIKDGGYPIGFADSVIRNLVRIIDFLPAYYVIGAAVMFIDRRSRRLGDLAAGTLVVKERRDLKLEGLRVQPPTRSEFAGAVPSASPAEPWVAMLHHLTPADQSLLREYALRWPSLDQQASAALAARLAALFAQKLEHDLGSEPPESFLARLSAHLGVQR